MRKCAPCALSCTAPAYVLEFCEEFPSQDILWIITISTSAHFLKQWWENSKMNFFWCKVLFSQSGKLGWNYFCRFFRDWEFLGRINFAEFSKTLALLTLGRIIFQDFPGWEILRRIIITTSADSNSSPTQNFFPGCDIHLFAKIFTPALVTYACNITPSGVTSKDGP